MSRVDDRDRFEAEERVQDVFEPNVLLPNQYFAAIQRKRYPSGEHRLLIALLRDALDCFQKYIHARDSKRRLLYAESEAWITDSEAYGAHSFNNVCDLLGMNPVYIREGLISWRDAQNEAQRTAREAQPSAGRTSARIVASDPDRRSGDTLP